MSMELQGEPEGDLPRRINHSARRINFLAKRVSATRYLEIGVQHGRTFFGVEIARKIAVDPKFRFDWQSKQDDNTRFFAMPSDAWFINHSRGEEFDVIFLDGLHTFEQTFRDFCNSLSVAHTKTIWVIDDTMPSDLYSAWPNQREAVTLRRDDLGIAKGTWQGDVFKTVFAIHDFFPMMNYCTVATGGNPQTLIWRQPRADFKPLFNSLDAISRLTYFDYKRRLQVMQNEPEDKALQCVLAGLGFDGSKGN
jgi:hypothetical protein